MHSHFQILLRGYMGLWENLGGGPLFLCFIAFLCYNFSKSFEGYMRCPPPPSCVHLCFCRCIIFGNQVEPVQWFRVFKLQELWWEIKLVKKQTNSGILKLFCITALFKIISIFWDPRTLGPYKLQWMYGKMTILVDFGDPQIIFGDPKNGRDPQFENCWTN